MRTATKAFYGTLKILAGAWNGMRALWTITVHFLSNVWTNFASGVLKAWNSTSGALKKAWTKLMGWITDDPKYEVELERVRAEIEAKSEGIEAKRRDKIAQSDQQYQEDRSRIRQDYESTIADLDKKERDAHEARQRKYEAELDTARDAVDRARTEWQDALAEAARKRRAVEEDTEKLDIAGLAQKLKSAGEVMDDIALRNIETRGTFNALAARGMGASGVAERTASATEETAKNTHRILQEMDENALAFE